MSAPSRPTLHKLYALSGNQCAFGGCRAALVDADTLIAVVCHINAQSPGGPRYNSDQTEEERHEPANLVIMCPNHAARIDKAADKFPVARLNDMKRAHEAKAKPIEVTDRVLEQLAAQFSASVGFDGSLITTHQQHGGQTAHQIINVGPSTARAAALPADVEYQRGAMRQTIEDLRRRKVISVSGSQVDQILRSANRDGVDPAYEPLTLAACAEAVNELLEDGSIERKADGFLVRPRPLWQKLEDQSDR